MGRKKVLNEKNPLYNTRSINHFNECVYKGELNYRTDLIGIIARNL